MSAAKFSLKAQGLITPIYCVLASAWEGEISEQGSEKKKKNRKKTSSVSEKEVCPKATHQPSTAPTQLPAAGTGATPLKQNGSGQCPAQGQVREEQIQALPWEDSLDGGRSRASDPKGRAVVGVGCSIPQLGQGSLRVVQGGSLEEAA